MTTLLMTTHTLPESDNAEYPWRYLIGYVHRRGFSTWLADLNEPPLTGAAIATVQAQIQRTKGVRDVTLIGMTLIAGPAGCSTVTVPASDSTTDPYRYVVTFRHATGFGVQVQDAPRPVASKADVEFLRDQIRLKNNGIESAVLSVMLMAAPARP